MKRFICGIVLLTAILPALFAQNAELPRLAVVEFSTNINNEKTKADAITVRNLVENQMVRTQKYQIITRDEIDKLLTYQKIQLSSISSAENIQKLKLENISYIITGTVDAMGNDYVVIVKILDVSTGKFSHSADDSINGSSLYKGINDLMAKFLAGMETKNGQVVQTGQKQAAYNIGDKGPGGGIIFHAEDGIYIEVSRNLGEYNWSGAIKAAKNYKGGGFNDWRLPSIGELEEILYRLRDNHIAGLRNGTYWSSSEDVNSIGFSNAWGNGSGGKWSYWKINKFHALAIRAF